MAEYVVFKTNTFEPANEVYFAYHLGDAMDLKDDKTAVGPDTEWEIAEVLPTDSWIIKLILWLHKRSK